MLLAILISAAAVTGEPLRPDRKLQKKLEQIARDVTPTKNASVEFGRLRVGDRVIILPAKPATGTDASKVLAEFIAANWDKAYCSPPIVTLMMERPFSIRLELERSGTVPAIREVSLSSCSNYFMAANDGSAIIGNAVFAAKPSKEAALEKIYDYFRHSLKDPYSAIIACGDVSEKGWSKKMLEPMQYGYFVICDINAKNSYGGYTGGERYAFRFNDAEAAVVQDSETYGLMTQLKSK